MPMTQGFLDTKGKKGISADYSTFLAAKRTTLVVKAQTTKSPADPYFQRKPWIREGRFFAGSNTGYVQYYHSAAIPSLFPQQFGSA